MSDDALVLTPAEKRVLAAQVADLDDRRRYLIMSRTLRLYHNASDDLWAAFDPRGGTLYKRRGDAVAVAKRLKRARVVTCRVNRHGILVLSSVPK